MKVTVKGQVTIPRGIREKLGIHPGSEVEFVEAGDRIVLKKADEHQAREEFRAALEKARGCFKTGMTTDEIMAMTRGED